MNDPIVVTRTLLKRAWPDVEQKIQWAFASGAVASGVLEVAKAYGIALPPIVSQELPFALAIFAGYLVPSMGQTVTTIKDLPSGKVKETEAHTGAAVSVVTSPTPIQRTAQATVARRASFTDVVENTPVAQDEKATEVMPGTLLPPQTVDSGVPRVGGAFLASREQMRNTGPQSIDSH